MAHQLLERRALQAFELDHASSRLGRELRQQTLLRRSPGAYRSKGRRHDQRRFPWIARDERQQRQGGRVDGVQVLENDQERSRARQLDQASRDAVKEPEAILLRVLPRCSQLRSEPIAPARYETRQHIDPASGRLSQGDVGARLRQTPQDLVHDTARKPLKEVMDP